MYAWGNARWSIRDAMERPGNASEHDEKRVNCARIWGACCATSSAGAHSCRRNTHGKIYSVHAPEVECIAKGKVPKNYEFGCKVPIVTTSRQSWIVGIDAVHDNP